LLTSSDSLLTVNITKTIIENWKLPSPEEGNRCSFRNAVFLLPRTPDDEKEKFKNFSKSVWKLPAKHFSNGAIRLAFHNY
jgi:hypothetical protein